MTDRISFIDFEEDEDTNIYCPMCEKLGFTARMGPKLILEGQQREPDHDSFLQCASCGWLCPIHQLEPEPEIQDSAEVIDSPYEQGEGIVMGTENRATSRKKKQRIDRVQKPTSRRRSQKLKQELDPDIAREIAQHGEDRVKVVYDSNP
jgi:hypothetical protein